MRGQAVQEDGLRVGELHQVGVHRVALEGIAPSFGFAFLTHRGPHVGVHDVRTLDGLLRHLRNQHTPTLLGRFELRAVRLEPLGAREPQLEAQDLSRLEPGIRHVVAVADPRDALSVPAAEVLLDREQVGEHLAGVGQIGEPVDHRNRGVARQLFDLGVVERADHDPIDVTGQDPSRIRDRLAAADLDVLTREEESLPAELVGADFERHPGAGGGLREDHRQGPAGEWGLAIAPRFHALGELEELLDLLAAEIGDLEEVALRHGPPESVKMTGLCDGFYPGLPGETRLRALQDISAEVLVFDNAKQSLPHRGSVEHDVFARIIG